MWFPLDTRIYLVPVCRSALQSLPMVYLPEKQPSQRVRGAGGGAARNVRKHIIQGGGVAMIVRGVAPMSR